MVAVKMIVLLLLADGRLQGGGSLDICRLLLEQSGERHVELANAPTTGSGSTPLHWAAWAGCTEIVDWLVVHGGADPHALNKRGANAAHYAAASGHLATCRYLYDRWGVDFCPRRACHGADTHGLRPELGSKGCGGMVEKQKHWYQRSIVAANSRPRSFAAASESIIKTSFPSVELAPRV